MEKHEPFRATLVLRPADKGYIVYGMIPATLRYTEVIYSHANVCQGINNSSPLLPLKLLSKLRFNVKQIPESCYSLLGKRKASCLWLCPGTKPGIQPGLEVSIPAVQSAPSVDEDKWLDFHIPVSSSLPIGKGSLRWGMTTLLLKLLLSLLQWKPQHN